MAKEITVVEKVKEEIMNVPQTAFTKEEKKTYQSVIRSINAELGKVEKSYLNIAFKLYSVYQGGLFQIDGYQTIYDFSKDQFDLARGTTNNYINICECFGYFDPETNYCTDLLPKWKEFGVSKLICLINMDDEFRNRVTADMSVKQIKELKRLYNDENSTLEIQPDSEDDISEQEVSESDAKNTKDVSLKSIEVSAVDDVLNMSREEQDIITDTLADFVRHNPNKTYSFSIFLNWEE